MKTEYSKIQSVYLRDPENRHKTFLEGQYSLPEFEYLSDNIWEFTEKVDGTNVRVIALQTGDAIHLEYFGRTDTSQIPSTLVNELRRVFETDMSLWDKFKGEPQQGSSSRVVAVLYGEGYGAGIQKAGSLYRDTQSFCLFDVKVGNWWLQRVDVEDVARHFDLDVVPSMARGTLHDMVELCREGFPSQWGSFPAEGIVARPLAELFTRGGDRIITKCKCKDFI